MHKQMLMLPLFLLALTNCTPRRSTTNISPPQPTTGLSADQLVALEAAAEYSEKAGGVSMLVWRNGDILYERYPQGSAGTDAHALHSGTKSFSCAIAVLAASDGLLSFDEQVADTITEWASNSQKSQITIRQLISLSSGLDGGIVGETPTYTEALDFDMVSSPGRSFNYGPVPFQLFGALMARKLGDESPLDYLERKVFEPIGLAYQSWDYTSDGEPHLPNGASLTAQEWLKYGILIINMGEWQGQQLLDKALLKECFEGSLANPAYGMAFWLPMAEDGNTTPENLDNGTTSNDSEDTNIPTDLIQASGAQGQRLYIIPSLGVVIVRQAERSLFQEIDNFSDERFFRLIQGFLAK